jgi:hypothetical protein
MNPRGSNQSAFGQIIVDKHGEKLQLILSLAREQSLRSPSFSNNKYNGMEGNVLISLLYNHTAEFF